MVKTRDVMLLFWLKSEILRNYCCYLEQGLVKCCQGGPFLQPTALSYCRLFGVRCMHGILITVCGLSSSLNKLCHQYLSKTETVDLLFRIFWHNNVYQAACKSSYTFISQRFVNSVKTISCIEGHSRYFLSAVVRRQS